MLHCVVPHIRSLRPLPGYGFCLTAKPLKAHSGEMFKCKGERRDELFAEGGADGARGRSVCVRDKLGKSSTSETAPLLPKTAKDARHLV